jgi:hypothetical protein
LEHIECFIGMGRLNNLKASRPQFIGQHHADQHFILDNENGRRGTGGKVITDRACMHGSLPGVVGSAEVKSFAKSRSHRA